MTAQQHYIGRFAPSPTGALHLGSLVCALASYLHAKQQSGTWLVRIEDIDPPREQQGATKLILETLQLHGLFWDDEVVYQSARTHAYLQTLNHLQASGKVYRCRCTRGRLKKLNGRYDRRCLVSPPAAVEPCALRFKIPDNSCNIDFVDEIQGSMHTDLSREGDFIVLRKDGLFAYQLAVVVDDISQGVTHVVRGADLLDTTANQIVLYNALNHPAPKWAHIPLVLDDKGNKLSKQNHALPLDNSNVETNLRSALHLLNIEVPRQLTTSVAILNFAVERFDCATLNSLNKGIAH